MLLKKYKIGISGHRDLKSSEMPKYKNRLKHIVKKKIEAYPNTEVSIITPLAEGSDQLLARVAKKLGLAYEVILPLPLELYKKDFSNRAYDEFYTLYCQAINTTTIATPLGTSLEEISDYGEKRDRQYLKVGQEVVDSSDFMIFLWDGIINHKRGGTADIFSYAKERYGENFNKKHSLIASKREKN